MIQAAEKILQLTRAKDWRLSFVPFIIGCVYLWLWWFKIELSFSSFLLFILSFITTFGFAALGYFINEFFDKEVDAKAGKINKLAFLPPLYQALLFIGCVAATFLPWLWLPLNQTSVLLFACEIFLFLIYSLPFPRLKETPLISGFIDSGYAYVVPLLLSFYTYSLFAHSENVQMIYVLAAAVFMIGFRNITIHHVNDIFKDKLSSTITLPQVIGVNATNRLVLVLLLQEIFLVLVWSLILALQQPLFWLWVIVYLGSLAVSCYLIAPKFRFSFLSIEPARHLTDPIYQYVFPGVTLLLAITTDYKWLLLVPFHAAFMLTEAMQKIAWDTIYHKSRALKYVGIRTVVVPIKIMGNYAIYYSFLAVGANLRKENMSAWAYIKKKAGR